MVKALYSLTEVARMLGVTRDVVRRWVEQGDLPSVTMRKGGKRWVPLSALRARAQVWESAVMAERLNSNRRV